MTGMRTIRHNSDGETTYECPVCLKHETVWSENMLTHEPGGLVCLQRQVTALQEQVTSVVEALMERFGGEI